MPTSTAVPPASAMPWRNPAASAGPDGRLSRPTASTGACPQLIPRRAGEARPSARANSGVSSGPTMPRTSYWRKIASGTFICAASGPGRHCAGERRRAPGAREARVDERSVGQTPKSRIDGHRERHGAARPAQEKRTWRCASGVRVGFIVIAMMTGR